MRHLLVGLCILCCSVISTVAQVSIGIGFPGVSIGINLPLYPQDKAAQQDRQPKDEKGKDRDGSDERGQDYKK